MYDDRTAAGRILCERLVEADVEPDVVLAASTGGLALTDPICDRFDAEVGLMVSEPIRLEATRKLPIGAVTDTGVSWLDDDLVEAFALDEETLEVEKQRTFREARDKHQLYEDIVDEPTPVGTVVVVEEGITCRVTLKACLWAMSQVDSCYPVAAAPVGVPDEMAELHTLANEVVVDRRVSSGQVLANFYKTFDSPSVTPQTDE